MPIIIKQRADDMPHSAISARAILSREFVDFFEHHLPTFITSVVSIFGAVLMLFVLDFKIGIASFVVLSIFLLYFA